MFDELITKYKFLKNIKIKSISNIEIKGVLLSKHNDNNLEVVLCSSNSKPNSSSLRSIWKDRKGGTATPLLVICTYINKASVCGPLGDEPPVYEELAIQIVKIISEEALDKKDYSLSLRVIKDMLSSLEQKTSGIRNEGLFANYVLSDGVKRRSDWKTLKEKAKKIIGKTGTEMLTGLGYEYESLDKLTYVLKASGKKRALGVLLKPDELIDIQNKRFGNTSPITHAFNIADRENLPFVVICSGHSIRIYSTNIEIGVGRKGRTETYVHCQTNLLTDEEVSLLWLIFSSKSIEKKGFFYELLEESNIFAGNLADNLRDRVYNHVIPSIALAITKSQNKSSPSIDDLDQIYSLSMLVLFRLLFIAYAEDKDLLPYKINDLYKKKSLKNIALEIKNIKERNEFFEFSNDSTYWDSLKHIFFAINNGNKNWGVPIYNGGLFSTDPELSPLGAKLEKLKISDKYFANALYYLLLIEDNEAILPIDFRSLGVREFGTIYEGLLESELSFADQNLELSKNNILVPLKQLDKEPVITKGTIYLNNKSGERKSTGSYYTKTFIVDHLLTHSLDTAVDKHLKKLDQLDEESAGDCFFDFKVADIAMGSGHFLISAIDHLEVKFSNYLSKRTIIKVSSEIYELRQSAFSNLKDLSSQIEIEDSQLLRRLIARKCIYGVDINPIAVELARLAIWIHTFVPGLPLSYLDHNLVVGNSLIGIGTLEEVKNKFYENEQTMPLLFSDPTDLLKKAIEPLKKFSSLADATISDIKKANRAIKEAKEAIAPANSLCDIVTASRIEKEEIDINLEKLEKDVFSLFGSSLYNKYIDILKISDRFHFPIAFPEVFLRKDPGFDVIIGNPPWEELTLEEDSYWARYLPGLHAYTLAEKKESIKKLKIKNPEIHKKFLQENDKLKFMRKALLSGQFEGMGKGDPDLYKGFCWRFTDLTNSDGFIGVVLPRSAFNSEGSTEFRKKIIKENSKIILTFLLNNKQWVFNDVHPQETIALFNLQKNPKKENNTMQLFKTISNYENFINLKNSDSRTFSISEINKWNLYYSIPTIPNADSITVFSKMAKCKKIAEFENNYKIRFHRELDATNDRSLILTDEKYKNNPDYWIVYKGSSFNLWEPNTGDYYGYGNAKKITKILHEKRLRSSKQKRSAFYGMKNDFLQNIETLPCKKFRIAFRNVSNRTDTRTFLTCLIPKNTFLTNAAPYLILENEDPIHMLYLLGIFSTIPFDWYTRLWTELNLNFFIVENFPVPELDKNSKIYNEIIDVVLELICQFKEFDEIAKIFSKKIKPLNEYSKEKLLSKLDALVAFAYKLDSKDIINIYETFHPTWDYKDRLDAVQFFYKKIK